MSLPDQERAELVGLLLEMPDANLHPGAERELRNAYLWYLERSETVVESPNRWPRLTDSTR